MPEEVKPLGTLQAITIHGPYEDAIIKALEVAKLTIESQPPEARAELWRRWLEWSAPLHKASVALSEALAANIQALLALLKPGG